MKIKKTKELFLSCNVAGFSHYEGCIVFDQLKIGSQLQLVREDENAYDHDAVAIFFGDSHFRPHEPIAIANQSSIDRKQYIPHSG